MQLPKGGRHVATAAEHKGNQSAFTNFSIYDESYYEALFGGKKFPDGSFMIDFVDEFMEYQKLFMEVCSEIRMKNVMTFPVLTFCLLREGDKFVSEDFAKWACKHNMKWGDSNFFVSSDVTSLSNCCFTGDQEVLVRSSSGIMMMPFQEFAKVPSKDRRNLTIYHNCSWAKGGLVTLSRRGKKIFKVVTANHKTLKITEDHINPTLRGDVRGDELKVGDYLMFSTMPLGPMPTKDLKLTYEQGFLIGAYAGDGSHSRGPGREGSSNQIIFSLNESNRSDLATLQRAIDQITDGQSTLHAKMTVNNVLSANVSSEKVYDFIAEWISGDYAHEKAFNLACLEQSIAFRRGIIDGWYATDGGNSNRIYSTSVDLIKTGEAILTSLGRSSIIDTSDRTDEKVVIRGQEYDRRYPLHCLRFYEESSKRKFKDVYRKRNNSLYFMITEIEEVECSDDRVYCFTMDDQEEPYFTLPNGVVTHNCRLVSDIDQLGYFNSIGGTALEVGSIKVNTINLAQIAYESNGDKKKFFELLTDVATSCMHALDRVRHIIRRNIEKGLLPNYTHGIVKMESQYNTVGLTSFYEMIKFFGYVTTDKFGYSSYTDEGIAFGEEVLKFLNKLKDDYSKDKDYKMNLEQVPMKLGQ